MTEDFKFNPHERAGWEQIWQGNDIPPRFQSFAPPSEAVVDWAKTVPTGGFILDVGCGVGRHAVYMGEQGFRVAGVDIAPSGVRLAGEACAARGIAFDGRVSTMTTLPWGDGTFDGALSIATIHHHMRAGVVQALAEVWRVLKPGGLFVVDFPCTDTIVYEEMRNMVAAGQILEVEPDTFVDENADPDVTDEFLPHHFCTEADARNLLQNFEIIKLWPDLQETDTKYGFGPVGKWVAWVRQPLVG